MKSDKARGADSSMAGAGGNNGCNATQALRRVRRGSAPHGNRLAYRAAATLIAGRWSGRFCRTTCRVAARLALPPRFVTGCDGRLALTRPVVVTLREVTEAALALAAWFTVFFCASWTVGALTWPTACVLGTSSISSAATTKASFTDMVVPRELNAKRMTAPDVRNKPVRNLRDVSGVHPAPGQRRRLDYLSPEGRLLRAALPETAARKAISRRLAIPAMANRFAVFTGNHCVRASYAAPAGG
ncbi:MAG TPA: hypothetical protein VJ890_26210 [Vineibacter sp.]|nr:hypothetical protein [Vineibacter sp.]